MTPFIGQGEQEETQVWIMGGGGDLIIITIIIVLVILISAFRV